MTDKEKTEFLKESIEVFDDVRSLIAQIQAAPPVKDKEGIDLFMDDYQNLDRLLAEFENIVQVPEIDDETFLRAKEQLSRIKKAKRILRELYS
jgi:hypothetical protein